MFFFNLRTKPQEIKGKLVFIDVFSPFLCYFTDVVSIWDPFMTLVFILVYVFMRKIDPIFNDRLDVSFMFV